MTDVATSLKELGLERYEPAFRESEITAAVLTELTEADLKNSVCPLGRVSCCLGRSLRCREGCRPSRCRHLQPARGAERRELTVLFCDLAGSTRTRGAARSGGHGRGDAGLSRRLRRDGRALGRARRQVHGRWPARLFWAAQAHEDEAERAVRGIGRPRLARSLIEFERVR
jgi:hypothetical protein